MKIVVSSNSYDMTKKLVKYDISEIFLGAYSDRIYKRVSFTGRGQFSAHNNIKTVIDFNEIRDIVNVCHDNGVKVSFLANIPFMVNDRESNNVYESEFINYINAGIDCKIDSVIVGSFNSLLLLKKLNVPANLVAGSFIGIFNEGTIKELSDLGANRVILPHHLTLDDITVLSKYSHELGMETEIFGLWGCSNIGGLCHFKHNAGENIDVGLPCRTCFELINNNNVIDRFPVLDAAEDCSICMLPYINNTKVDYIKIFGRDKDPTLMISMTKTISEILKLVSDGADSKECKKYILKKIPWWHQFCSEQKCKYKENKISRSFV